MVSKNRKNLNDLGQTMVEFAMVLPVVLMLVFGIIEFGFLLWSYSSVNSAAREAARYGIAVGDGVVSGQRYYDCEGIRNAAMKAGAFAGMEPSDVFIHYDDGQNLDQGEPPPKYISCEQLAADGGDDDIVFGDRIVVSVTHDYRPIASLMGFEIQPFNMIARSNRTIVKNATVAHGDGGGSGGGGGGGGTACFTPSLTHTGEGGDPTVSPTKSADCDTFGEYEGGEYLTLTASPAAGWSVAGWTNTEDDTSNSAVNYLNMPGAPGYVVTVHYVNTSPTCRLFNFGTTGTGTGSYSLSSSTVCTSANYYVNGEVISINVTPDVGNEVISWSGTEDDASTSNTNTVKMPDSPYSASVRVDLTNPTCYALSVSHTGNGTDPVPTASNCAGGLYAEGSLVSLNATADIGYEVDSWSGTNNDASTSNNNAVTMDGDKAVSVTYVQSYTPGPPVGVVMPNADDQWHWNAGIQACQKLDLRWAANPIWGSESPINYEVFRGNTSYGTINSTYWDADFSIPAGTQITVGVRAIFGGGVTSSIQEVTYMCLVEDFVYWGSLVK